MRLIDTNIHVYCIV